MTQVATPETVRADVGDGTVVIPLEGSSMIVGREGGELWADFDDPDWNGIGSDPPRIRRPLVLVTGSHHQQVYWYPTGRSRELGQLPAMYLLRERQWVPRRAAFLQPPGGLPASQSGRWNATCIACHATDGRSGLDESGQFRSTAATELGIACEACHGPGELHQKAYRNPLRRYLSHLRPPRDHRIVEPRRLGSQLSSQVCGQCHAIWTSYEPASSGPSDAARYRPGDELSKQRFIVRPSRNADSATMKKILAAYPRFIVDSFWPDGMVRVSGREYNGLIDSPCFADATDPARTLSCFSCHTMHKTANDPRPVGDWADTYQVSHGMEGNEACLQCHGKFRGTLTAHTRHKAESAGSSCYNCHMPYTSYGLLRAQRSHQISSPDVTASLHTGRPNACNLCHLDKSLGWAATALQQWYGIPRPPLDRDEQDVAASILWLLRGDAGQRALVGWSMGWKPGQIASGTAWLPPYLAVLLDDPYDAVRFVAGRALRTLPGFETFSYDFVAAADERMNARGTIMQRWEQQKGGAGEGTALLLDARGAVNRDAWLRLLGQRDDRDVSLNE